MSGVLVRLFVLAFGVEIGMLHRVMIHTPVGRNCNPFFRLKFFGLIVLNPRRIIQVDYSAESVHATPLSITKS